MMKRAVILVNLVGVLLGTSYGMLDPIFLVFAKNVIGISYVEVGILGMMDIIPYAFIPVFVGFLLYRYNNGKILIIGVVFNAVAIFLFSLGETLHELIILNIITGIGFAFFWPSCMNIITNVSEEENRLRNRVIFHGCITGGMMMGPIVDVLFFTFTGATSQVLFQVSALILVVGIITSLPLYKKRVTVHQMRISISSLRWVTKFPLVITMVLYCSACLGIVFTTHSTFLSDRFLTPSEISIIYFLLGVSRIVMLFCATQLAKKLRYTTVFGTVLMVLGMAIAYSADTVIEFAASIILLGFGISLFYPLALEIILSKTSKSQAGIIIGTYETIFGIGAMSGAATAGIISEVWGIGAPYIIYLVAGGAIATFAIIKRKSLNTKNVACGNST